MNVPVRKYIFLCISLIAAAIGILKINSFNEQQGSEERRLATNCHWNNFKSATVCDNPVSHKDAEIKEAPKPKDSPKDSHTSSTTKAKESNAEKAKPWMKLGAKKKVSQGAPIECDSKPLHEHVAGTGKSGLKNGLATNVILMIVDDLQPDGVSSFKVRPRPSSERSCYQFMNTPNLDKLAHGGALFSRAYTPHPLCSPSRYAILTGRYASRSRRAVEMSVQRSRDHNPPLAHLTLNGNAWVVNGTITVAHALQQAGFKTAMTGKWHLSSTVETESSKHKGGFTYQDAKESPKPYQKEKAEVKYAGFDDVFALYPLNMKDSGFDWFSHNPEWMTVSSFDWWDKTAGNKFLYYAFTLPHMPFSGAAIQHGVERIPDVHTSLTDSQLSRMTAMRDRSRHHIQKGNTVATHNAMGSKWASMSDKMHNIPGLFWIDSIVGEFIQHLEQRKELNSTMLIFGADHGNVAKGHCFEPAMRVPLIIHCPVMIRPHTIVDAVVANIDISSTMLDAIGIGDDFMRKNGRVVDGRSMLPLVAPKHVGYNPKKEIHEAGVYCEIYSDRSLVGKNYTLIDLSRTTYKEPPYNREPWGDKLQLYKSTDVEQKVNLLSKAMRQEDPLAAHHLSKLTSALTAHLKDTVPKCQLNFYPKQFPTLLTSKFT